MTMGVVIGMVGIVRMEVEGPIPPCMNGGMVGTMMDRAGPPLFGSGPTTVCEVVRGPLGTRPIGPTEGISGMTGGTDTSPLLTIPPLKGVRRCTDHGAIWGSERGRFRLI